MEGRGEEGERGERPSSQPPSTMLGARQCLLHQRVFASHRPDSVAPDPGELSTRSAGGPSISRREVVASCKCPANCQLMTSQLMTGRQSLGRAAGRPNTSNIDSLHLPAT